MTQENYSIYARKELLNSFPYFSDYERFENDVYIVEFPSPHHIYRKINGVEISSCFETTTDVTGTLKIIEINKSNRFIAGIFEFQAINQKGKIVDFTEGRFDLQVLTNLF